jgi:hypothetical protein
VQQEVQQISTHPRALLLSGEDADRVLARGPMSALALATIICLGRAEDTCEQAIRRAEARRLALGIREMDRALVENKKQSWLRWLSPLAPRCGARGVSGPVSAA